MAKQDKVKKSPKIERNPLKDEDMRQLKIGRFTFSYFPGEPLLVRLGDDQDMTMLTDLDAASMIEFLQNYVKGFK